MAAVVRYVVSSWRAFAPLGGGRRDNGLELQIRAQLEDDVRIEDDLSRWFPVWHAPGI